MRIPSPRRPLARRAWLWPLAAAALLLSAVTALPADGATAGCRAAYTVDEWAGGFTASVHVTNLGAPLSGWQARWTYAGDQRITSAWNAVVTQDGAAVTAANESYNAGLATGASADFGVQGTWSASDPTPTAITLNGTACDGSVTTTPPTTPPSSPPTGTPSAGCAGAAVCSDFEDQGGAVPSGAWTTAAPDCSGTGTVAVDTSVAHSGTRSIRVDGRAGYCNHAFLASTADLSAVGPVLYLRLWVRHTTALPSGHVAFVSMPDAAQGGRALRIGGQNGALQWNRESDDATLPAQSPAGIAQSRPLPTGGWHCLRMAIGTGAPALDTWLDDQEVPGLHVDGVPTQDVDQQWLSDTVPPRPTALRLGWESYGTGDDTVWFDDVAAGPSPIAC